MSQSPDDIRFEILPRDLRPYRTGNTGVVDAGHPHRAGHARGPR